MYGLNPCKTTVFKHLGFTEEHYWSSLPEETRGIIPEDVPDHDLKKICEKVILKLTNTSESLVESSN